MKVYTQLIAGCIWCPFHTRYGMDNTDEGRCDKVHVRNDNAKLIREHELRSVTNDYCDFMVFPDWCPLENKGD